jgi:hypothetical protein
MVEPRRKGKEYTRKLSQKAVNEVEKTLKNDLQKKYDISNFTIKLGKFRGFNYISSCKITLKPKNKKFKKDSDVNSLIDYLQKEYSPKFKLVSILDGQANLNIR